MRKKLRALVSAVAIGVAVFAAVGMLSSPQQAEATDKVVVTISGDVIGVGAVDGLPLHVGAQASGPAGTLNGQGFDIPPRRAFGIPIGYCRIPLVGTLVGDVVTLSGNVSFSNDPDNVGVPVTFTANTMTGVITFDFGPFTFIGSGRVRVSEHQ